MNPILVEPLDDSPAIVFFKDLEGRYLRINRRYTEQLGVTEAELHGRTDSEVEPRGAIDGPRLANGGPATKEPMQLEYTVGPFEGRPGLAVWRFPVRGPNGEPVAVCGVAAPVPEAAVARAECARLMELERAGGAAAPAEPAADERRISKLHEASAAAAKRAHQLVNELTVEREARELAERALGAARARVSGLERALASAQERVAELDNGEDPERLRAELEAAETAAREALGRAERAEAGARDALIKAERAEGAVAAERERAEAAVAAERERAERAEAGVETERRRAERAVEAEAAAEAERRRADQAEAAVEAERHRAEQAEAAEKAARDALRSAGEAGAAAEAERHHADQAEAAAEAERRRADQAEAAAEAERERADRAETGALEALVRVDLAEAAADTERMRADQAEAVAVAERMRADRAEAAAAQLTATVTLPDPAPAKPPSRPRWDATAQLTLTEAIAGASEWRIGVKDAVNVLGPAGGWDAICAWRPDPRDGLLRCFCMWTSDPDLMGEFETATWQRPQRAADTALGGALSSSDVRWLAADEEGPDPRLNAVARQGISTAVLVPIRSGAVPVAVLEMMGRTAIPRDPTFATALEAVGLQLGHFWHLLEAGALPTWRLGRL